MKVDAEKFISDLRNKLTTITKISSADRRKLYLAQGEILQRSIMKQFDTRGRRYLGHEWAPLRPSTLRRYQKLGYDLEPTLSRNKILFNSLRTSVDSEGPLVGTNVRYAEWLQFGTRNMSPRPFLPMAPFQKTLLEEDKQKIREVTLTLLKNKMKSAK